MRSPIQLYLERLVEATDGDVGEVAQYIPELAHADPDRFALCLATVDGQVYAIGDADHRYSVQSISKPFAYALALHDHGPDEVAAKVDIEPSGDAFNEISLDPASGRPRNPLINSGAIAVASMIGGDGSGQDFEHARRWFGRFAGRSLDVDEDVYRSEVETAHRNRAIVHMLREVGIIETDPEAVLRRYVRQCSLSVSTRDLASMAATLANRGVHPVTHDAILPARVVEQVLSVMATCGMYDAAGDWLTSVGIPAKSGVSGGLIGVLPGQIGIAVFSPRLDPHGNSARGVALFERMSRDMELHLMHVGRGSRNAIRNSYTLADVESPTRRDDHERAVLERVADRCRFYELNGDLLFAGVETVVRHVVDHDPELAVLDLTHVHEIADVARKALLGLRTQMSETGAEPAVVDPDGLLFRVRSFAPDAAYFDDVEAAVEWAETTLLRRYRTND